MSNSHVCAKCVNLSQREMRAMIELSYAKGPLRLAKQATITNVHNQMIEHVKTCKD